MNSVLWHLIPVEDTLHYVRLDARRSLTMTMTVLTMMMAKMIKPITTTIITMYHFASLFDIVFHNYPSYPLKGIEDQIRLWEANSTTRQEMHEEGQNEGIKLYQLMSIGVLRGHTNVVVTVAFDSSGKYIASGGALEVHHL